MNLVLDTIVAILYISFTVSTHSINQLSSRQWGGGGIYSYIFYKLLLSDYRKSRSEVDIFQFPEFSSNPNYFLDNPSLN